MHSEKFNITVSTQEYSLNVLYYIHWAKIHIQNMYWEHKEKITPVILFVFLGLFSSSAPCSCLTSFSAPFRAVSSASSSVCSQPLPIMIHSLATGKISSFCWLYFQKQDSARHEHLPASFALHQQHHLPALSRNDGKWHVVPAIRCSLSQCQTMTRSCPMSKLQYHSRFLQSHRLHLLVIPRHI